MVAKSKRWLFFLLIAALLQGMILLFCTEAGLTLVYPGLVRFSGEDYDPESNSYVVYYDMRIPVSDTDLVVVGMDFTVEQSYDAFIHLFRFIKQYNNVQTLYLDDEEKWTEDIRLRMEDPMTDSALPDVLAGFADDLQSLNDKLPPQKKFTVDTLRKYTRDTLPEDLKDLSVEPISTSAVILMDRDELMQKEIRNTLHRMGAVCVEMKYVNCETDCGIRSDIDLPFIGESERFSFLAARKIDWFYRYWRRVTGISSQPDTETEENGPETMSAEYCICVINGTPASLMTADSTAAQ